MLLRPLRLAGFAIALAVMGLAPVLRAETTAPLAELARTMRLSETILVLRDEGFDYGETLEAEMFPGRGGPDWQRALSDVYDAPGMEARFLEAFGRAFAEDHAAVAAAQAFFASPRGQQILTLELEARRALLDKEVEDAATAQAAKMEADRDPRLKALERYVEANDLIESNVQGALNANLAFFQGMAEGGAFGPDMTEEQMLSDVWAQEAEIRVETTSWLLSYHALAYGPLSDADLEAYTAFSLTPEGQRLNRALFAAFDAVFTEASHALGRAAAGQMLGEDI